MKNRFIPFLCVGVLLLLGCFLAKPKQTLARIPATHFQLRSLEAVNLSEDMSPVSTKADEVFLQVDLVRKEATRFERKTILQSSFNCSEKKRRIDLSLAYKLHDPKADYLVFSLVELDERNSEAKVQQVLGEGVTQGLFLSQDHFFQIDSLLGDDDFLGMQFLNLSTSYFVGKDYLTIAGRQLFDRFEYRLHYQWKVVTE
ncbi:MAG: hypothetical protein AB8G15_18745 [Saprospiraceae bacterium]